jgi:hypothetical protein
MVLVMASHAAQVKVKARQAKDEAVKELNLRPRRRLSRRTPFWDQETTQP